MSSFDDEILLKFEQLPFRASGDRFLMKSILEYNSFQIFFSFDDGNAEA